MKNIEIIITAIISLILGGCGMYLYNKLRKNKKTNEANQLVGESEANDDKRKEAKTKIEEQIEKNKILQEKLKEKLK